MKLFHQLTLLLATFLLISSCSNEEFDREPLLKVDKETLTFSPAASVESVPVSMNEGDGLQYVVTSESGIDWINVTTTSEGFEVSVLDNNTLETRAATIKVLLLKGSLSASVSVTQAAGGEIYINVSKENFDFEKEESEATILIEANTEWSLSIDAADLSWLTVDDSQKDKNILVVTAVENTTNKRRVAKIKLLGSGKESVVTFTQKGIMHFDFPFLEMGYIYEGAESERGVLYPNSMRDANGFEVARGSVYQRNSSYTMYKYNTLSSVFYNVEYEVHNPGGGYASVKQVLLNSSIPPLELQDDADFMEYLAEEGFEFAWKSDALFSAVYWNKERKIALQLSGTGFMYTETIMFTHSNTRPNDPKNQVDEFKTFDAMPVFYSEWGATTAQIRAWEEARGSTFLPGDSYGEILLAFAPDPAVDPDIIERVYSLDREASPTTLLNTTLLFRNTEKIFYNGGMIPDFLAFAITREYKALMEENGYIYTGQLPASMVHHFDHEAKGLHHRVSINNFHNEGYIPRLCMQISPREE